MEEIRIVDTHVHLSDRKRWQSPAYDWHSCNERLGFDFTPEMYAKETAGLPIGATVFMECMACKDIPLKEEEAKWACQLAESGRLGMKGVVANCPLGDVPRADVAAYLDRIAHPMLKGVRNLIQGEAEGFGISTDYIEGCREVAARGLTIDLCIKGQMDDVVQLAQAVPEARFILDHIGKPNIKRAGGPFDAVWGEKLRVLAALPNVFCKVSGIVTEVEEFDWTPDAIEPYVAHTIECFGWDRVIYGSDWYASKLATPEYRTWLEALQALPVIVKASQENRKKLFEINATAFYNLGSVPSEA
eukprot:TRINITY_DN3445_c3_g1_i1.p1 TRINITY_DN3445_c3_g1~~TRINITY_DN3445_c3_g1_i1.p1  ORF type:complete len:345 (+),score=113.17 TRINITY_DN3445_c3_g1_i1:130-1035(+)